MPWETGDQETNPADTVTDASEHTSARYLLLLDILGFRDAVRERAAEEIYAIIDHALESFDRWERLNNAFKTIYFSDTILFYQDPPGYGDWAFLDAYAVGALLLASLLGKKIPVRGSISFGQFVVRKDSRRKHDVYFGKALIEAYEAAQRENWIGITVEHSAWKVHEHHNPGTIDAYQREGVWLRRHDGVLLLNPFLRIMGWFQHNKIEPINLPYDQWDSPEFPDGLRGFRFLVDRANEFANSGDYSNRVAVKYHSTVAFLRAILGTECFQWADDASRSF